MAEGAAAPAEVLAVRDFRRLWWGVVTSQIGDWLHLTALGWYVLELGGDAASVANVMAAGLLPQLLLTLVGGVAADRWPKRRVLLVVAGSQLMVAAAFAGLVLAGALQIGGLLAFAFLLGCLAALWQPVYLSYIPDLVPEERLENAMGLSLSALYTARAVGPALAGVLIALVGTQLVFVVNAVSFLAPLLVLDALRVEGAPPERSSSPLRSLKRGFLTLRRDRVLLALWACTSALSLLALPFLALVPVYAKEVLLGSALTLGVLMAAIGLGQLVGAGLVSFWMARSMQRSGLLQLAGYLLMGVLLVAFALSTSVAVGVLTLFGFNLAHGFLSPRVNATVQRRMESERGTGQALFLLTFGLVPLGQIVLGWLAVRMGVVTATTVFGALFIVITLAVLVGARELREYGPAP